MATMRVAQISRPGGPFEIVERSIPEPGPGQCASRSWPAEFAIAIR